MKKLSTMKTKTGPGLLGALLCLLLIAAGGNAAFAQENYPAPDFYVRVSGAEGSINFRAGAGTSSQIYSEIRNGEILHISDMQYNRGDDLFFGNTYYQGRSGWVSLRQTTVLTGGDYGLPDFYVAASADGGSLNFRQDAGTSAGIITEIPNGTQLHITDIRYNQRDDFFFGYTSYQGRSGWVSLRQTTILRGQAAGQTAGQAAGQKSAPSVPAPSTSTPQPTPAPQPSGTVQQGSVTISFGE